MMRLFRRRRALDDFMDGIRPELTSLPTPAVTDALRARILASRAAGVRTILPAVPDTPRMSPRLAVGVAVAAALVVLLVPPLLETRRSTIAAGDVAGPGFFGHAAFAALPARQDATSAAPAPVEARAIGRLRPVALEFERRRTDSTGRVARSQIAIDVSAASLDGREAWRVVHVNRDPLPVPHVAVETVYVAQADMRLMRRTIHVSPYSRFQRINVWQEFRGDSVTGRMNTERPGIGAGRVFARRLPATLAPFLTESMSPVFFSSVALHPGWSGSASLLGWAVRDDDVLLPVQLFVEGEDTVTVPAGTFDCWRLSLRFAGRRLSYWTRKSDGLGVRMLDTTTVHGRETREVVLTRISR